MIYGLGNIIPQSVARLLSKKKGPLRAWREARVYIILGLAPTLAYFAMACPAPPIILQALYGRTPPISFRPFPSSFWRRTANAIRWRADLRVFLMALKLGA